MPAKMFMAAIRGGEGGAGFLKNIVGVIEVTKLLCQAAAS